MTILHKETAGDGAELCESEPLIKMAGVDVAFNDSVELQHLKAMGIRFMKAVLHKLFADVLSSFVFLHAIGRVGNMTASADVVGMQDVKLPPPNC